ncbi:MAG: glutathione S-transferase family protein [Alphaproteobacteria bacterium]|nr:glutathione S-transferase family protein [Alphaproteobacteria bacterium]
MMKLYSAVGTCALATHIALEEAGADYEVEFLDFSSKAQAQPSYLNVNAKGRVPALVTDRGVLTETPAILHYLAAAYPDAGLAPRDDIFALARMNEFNSYLCSTVHVAHAHKQRGHRWADEPSSFEDMRRKIPETATANFTAIEKHMFKGPWVMGDDYSAADGYLFTVSGWLKGDGVDIAIFPAIADHNKRMRDRPAVAKALSMLPS